MSQPCRPQGKALPFRPLAFGPDLPRLPEFPPPVGDENVQFLAVGAHDRLALVLLEVLPDTGDLDFVTAKQPVDLRIELQRVVIAWIGRFAGLWRRVPARPGTKTLYRSRSPLVRWGVSRR